MRLATRKRLLIAAVAATAAATLLFVRWDEPTAALQTFKMLAKAGALGGTVLVVWQLLLGFRAAAGRLLTDLLWVFNVHKTIGRYALFLIALHPVFITLYYVVKNGYNPLILEGGFPFAGYVTLGMTAILLFLAVVVTSVFFRARMPAPTWFGVHLSAYLAVVLVFVHSLPIGMTVGETSLRPIWWGLGILAGAVLALRAAFRLGAFTCRHTVAAADRVGPGVTRITMRPSRRRADPRPGQFIYLRRGLWGPARPFTVSHYDGATGDLSVSVKALGPTTTWFQSTKPGEAMYIDGPYGVFGRAALRSERPVVMVAGGIGITPFPRLIEAFSRDPRRDMVLFYGNKKPGEIVYGDRLESLPRLRVVHVISHDPDFPGEKGFITTELMKRHLDEPLPAHEFLICGPPAMTAKLEAALRAEGVPGARIHHELFSY